MAEVTTVVQHRLLESKWYEKGVTKGKKSAQVGGLTWSAIAPVD